MIHLLNWGMGVESTAILVRWILEPETRPFKSFADLVVIVAQTGNERQVTKELCETHILPLLREHRIRLVQVCRTGEKEANGYTVLDDSTKPTVLHTTIPHSLGHHFVLNGTIQRLGKPHFCAMKWKGFVLDSWIRNNIGDSGFGPYIGYNKDEGKRVETANDYGCRAEKYLYPLMEWRWSRARCLQYLFQVFGVVWEKSCCVFCPFQRKAEVQERWKAETTHPAELVEALQVAGQATAFNPRMKLFGTLSALDVAQAVNPEAVSLYDAWLESVPWNVYRVRRIFKAKAFCDRAIDFELESVNRAQAEQFIEAMGNVERDFWLRSWQRHKGDGYPTTEEFFVAAPVGAMRKARHRANFEQRWDQLTGRVEQLELIELIGA